MKNSRLFCLTVAVILSGCEQAPTGKDVTDPGGDIMASPTPEPTEIDGFKVGHIVADLYNTKTFCYGFDQASNTCTALETLQITSGDTIRISRVYLKRFSKRAPSSLDDIPSAAVDAFISDDGAYFYEIQTLDVTPQGLCRDKATKLSDVSQSTYKLIWNFSKLNETHDPSSDWTERQRDRWSQSIQSQIGDVSCSRYKFDDVDSTTIYEYITIDGTLQPGNPNLINLLDRNSSVSLRPS